MKANNTDTDTNTHEPNIYLAEYQAYIIDELITSFDELVTWWLVDCGYDEGLIRRDRWGEVGHFERQLYHADLVAFARKVAWTHI